MNVSLYHDSRKWEYRSIFGAAPTDSVVRLALDVVGEAAAYTVFLRLWQGETGETLMPMYQNGNRYVADLSLPEQGCLIWYYFIIEKDGKRLYYGNNNEQLGGIGTVYSQEPPSYQITVYDRQSVTPNWFKHAIVYQIFPDRFFMGASRTTNLIGKPGAVIHSCWNDVPYYCKNMATGDVIQYDFFGGNLAGIREKLYYLKDLGITALYLNPIFESRSNHRYDTGDYHRIDPFLGTNREFAELCEEANAMGIRIILDGVFNHTGEDSRYFNKYGTYPTIGAYQSKDSPYYDWYKFTRYPDEYESWWGVKALPDVDETNPAYMDFIINGEDSVLRYWLRQGISGWRLDVVDELPPTFLQRFYQVLKEEDPEAVLIGETWEDASNKVSYSQQRQYLCGHNLDSAMNYMLRTTMFQFILGKKDGRRTNTEIMHQMENYPKENMYAMLNLIGSHDVERALTLLGEGISALPKTGYNLAVERLCILSMWQMTMPGAPCIYYGDEVGMEGCKDPDNRRTYPWGNENGHLLDWCRRLTRLRRNSAALRTGRFIPLYGAGDIYAYCRSIEGGRDVFGAQADDGFYIIVMNRNSSACRTISIYTDGLAYGCLQDVLHPETAPIQTVNSRLTVRVPPLYGMVLQGAEPEKPKRAGILLHPTSLVSNDGIGNIGTNAFHFVDFLAASGQTIWQILPLSPTGSGDSPYQSPSAFAGNPCLISLEKLIEKGWLSRKKFRKYTRNAQTGVSYTQVWQWKRECLWNMAQENNFFIKWQPYKDFCKIHSYWLDDYALYSAITDFYNGRPWYEWPDDIRQRQPEAMKRYREMVSATVFFYSFLQYIFFLQWEELKNYANEHFISILGDVPIFIAYNSADCWAHQEFFDLDEHGRPNAVAGVPPDYFSADGQLWGNPIYRWEVLKKDGYRWWIERFKTISYLADEIRIDHFRGFASYWAVDKNEKTARVGTWQPGPGAGFFQILRQAVPDLRLVAEDLGVITDEVCELKDKLGLPGMRVLHFHTKDRDDGEYVFDTEPNCLAYTGTHDNNTTLGWYMDELNPAEQKRIRIMVHMPDDATPQDVVRALIAYVYSRRAETAIIPMQDLLTLPGSCRMNTPGTATGNWHWQMSPGLLTVELAKELSELCEQYNR